MSRRDDHVLLQDMITTAHAAMSAVQGRDPDTLADDHIWTLGLVKCIEIIGEAASRLSADLRDRHPTIPWSQIIGMRNRLVHAYFDIDYEQVWKTLDEDLPPLVEQLEELLKDESPNA